MKFDIRDVVSLMESQMDSVLATVIPRTASFIVDRLTRLANDELKTTAVDYVQGLTDPQSVQIEGNKLTINLVGNRAVAIEEGWSSFDMKPGLLGGRDFRDIPFRHMTPGTSGSFGREMSKDAYSSMRGAVKAARGKLGVVRSTFRTPGKTNTRQTAEGNTLRTKHKTGIESDMMALRAKVGKAIQTSYQTVRRVSRNSPEASWMNKGFKGAHLSDKIENELQKAIPDLLQDTMDDVGVGK